MAIPLVLVLLPLGLLFLLSGLVVNTVQAVLFLTIRPFSKRLYRQINVFLAELLWLQLIWLVDWWAGIKVQVYADPETWKLMVHYDESPVFDGQRSGCLGSAIAIMKKSSKFLPVIGWSMWFAEYLFLERSWAKDEKTLKSGLQRLKDFPRSFWLALFVEGTRFTPAKLLAAQEYAVSQGLTAPRNVLIPRTKGFVSAVSIMRDFVPAIYDTTVIIPEDSPKPTMLRILQGQSSVVHVRIKRHSMSDMPNSDEDVSKWCKDIFVAKDALLDKHIATGTFDEEIIPIGRPVKSLMVVLSWSCLLLYGAHRFLQWTQLLSTWKGVILFASGLAMESLLEFIEAFFYQTVQAILGTDCYCQPGYSVLWCRYDIVFALAQGGKCERQNFFTLWPMDERAKDIPSLCSGSDLILDQKVIDEVFFQFQAYDLRYVCCALKRHSTMY
uniref:1-acylglycerol-3-phosphate O-acyltransferase n=1 Tax=Aegilops tauschii TaxID=37682 RepID=M8BP86_AEGTA